MNLNLSREPTLMGSWEIKLRKLLPENLTFMDTARRSIGGLWQDEARMGAVDEARMGALRNDND